MLCGTLRSPVIAPVGHFLTHTVQPLHLSVKISGLFLVIVSLSDIPWHCNIFRSRGIVRQLSALRGCTNLLSRITVYYSEKITKFSLKSLLISGLVKMNDKKSSPVDGLNVKIRKASTPLTTTVVFGIIPTLALNFFCKQWLKTSC